MSISGKKRDSFCEINITPLTDIFLVLLIIMMVIAPLLDQQGLNLIVPTEHEAKKQENEPKIMTVYITDKGEFNLDGQNITKDGLFSSIEAAYKVKTDGLLIKADQESAHGDVVLVMDAAQRIGIKNISVVERAE
ncbi:MAG TPA: biopolymer transporter ExbD [Candidatus Gastranaerophilales bacterium]|nr:biopolymer transporter ExbD [Candidatus Gastranaerophilales bacterium]